MVIIITTILSGNMSVATGLDSSCCPTDYGGERVGVVCLMAPPLASSHPSLQRNTDRNQTNTVSANAGSRKNSRAAEKNKCIYKVECVLPLLAGRWAPSWIWFGQKVFSGRQKSSKRRVQSARSW